MVHKNYETLKALTKFPCIVAGKHGVMSVSEPAYREMFNKGSDKEMKVISISGEQLQTGSDHAIIGYLIEFDYDGSPMKCTCTSTWLKEKQQLALCYAYRK
ncbi:hypothetical protein MKP07_26890 [Niabella hibiscisoli]|nr:hypothetical protein [Niabella hibiscisoli]